MNRISTVSSSSLDKLLTKLGRRIAADGSAVIPFTDYTEMLTALLSQASGHQTTLYVAGHASPEVILAADRAGLKMVEVLGASPFVNHAEDIIDALESEENIVYLANPNWVTGSSFSFPQLNQVAQALGKGTLILDEKYHDFYGITGLPLFESHDRTVIIRSLSAGFSIGSDGSGFLAGATGTASATSLIEQFKASFAWSEMSTTMFRLLDTVLANESLASKRLAELHEESLRIAHSLTELGVQNRITATDFLLLRVADPVRVGNHLASFGCPVENLDGYPDLANYVRYRIQSLLSNDNFIADFRRMPAEYYKMDDFDKRAIMFHRPGETDSTKSTTRDVAQSDSQNRLWIDLKAPDLQNDNSQDELQSSD